MKGGGWEGGNDGVVYGFKFGEEYGDDWVEYGDDWVEYGNDWIDSAVCVVSGCCPGTVFGSRVDVNGMIGNLEE